MTAERTAPPRRFYLDTSAYLCVLLGEAGSDKLAHETADAELLSSVLFVLEARRNLVRLARAQMLKPAQYDLCVARLEEDAARFTLRDVTLDLCTSSVLPAVSTPRSLDLVHLRTALWFHAEAPLDRFATMDEAQRAAAKELGLPV